MKLTIDNYKSMMNLSLANVKAREEEFSKLDAIAGDGDHGTAIVTALTIIAGDAQQGTEFPATLNDMGMGVMMRTSGSTSTVLGALFMGMGEAVDPLGVTDEVNSAQVKVMFRGGLTGGEEQTKAKLGTSEAKGAVESVLSEYLTYFLEENPNIGKTIIEKGMMASRARDAARKARELVRRKTGLENTRMPGKLTDCTSRDPYECEIYIVEGNSAGGSAI